MSSVRPDIAYSMPKETSLEGRMFKVLQEKTFKIMRKRGDGGGFLKDSYKDFILKDKQENRPRGHPSGPRPGPRDGLLKFKTAPQTGDVGFLYTRARKILSRFFS
jgi:hypothetical protein